MRAVLHLGMHKTGSTSIQRSLYTKRDGDFLYLPWRIFSHSTLFRLLFEDAGSVPLREKVRGKIPKDRTEERRKWHTRVRAAMSEHSGNGPVVLSAERGGVAPRAALLACREFFAEAGADPIDVVHYLRPPRSFCASVFQQHLKDGGNALKPDALWPNYRKRVQKLDEVFGQDRVQLPLFAPDRLAGGNVVADFCTRVGIPIEQDEIVSSNESLSAEAQALLFVQRRFGSGQSRGSATAVEENRRLLQALRAVEGQRLMLSEDIMAPLFARHAADLDWIEARIGAPLPQEPPKAGCVIASESDLVELAMQAAAELAEAGRPGFAGRVFGAPEDLAEALDAIKLAPKPAERDTQP